MHKKNSALIRRSQALLVVRCCWPLKWTSLVESCSFAALVFEMLAPDSDTVDVVAEYYDDDGIAGGMPALGCVSASAGAVAGVGSKAACGRRTRPHARWCLLVLPSQALCATRTKTSCWDPHP